MSDAPPELPEPPASPEPPESPPVSPDLPWAGQRVVVAVTGGIAGYKSASLVSRLVQQGAVVRVIMTEAATQFVGPLTFQSLTGQTVLTSTWQADEHPESQHVGLARWCNLFIIAPCTANTLAKLAHGLCDDVVALTAAALPHTTARLIAPAMNADMWANPVIQGNLAIVTDTLGYHQVGPEEGWQACRTRGLGRMSEPESILAAAAKLR